MAQCAHTPLLVCTWRHLFLLSVGWQWLWLTIIEMQRWQVSKPTAQLTMGWWVWGVCPRGLCMWVSQRTPRDTDISNVYVHTAFLSQLQPHSCITMYNLLCIHSNYYWHAGRAVVLVHAWARLSSTAGVLPISTSSLLLSHSAISSPIPVTLLYI